ncbi:MAG: cobalamin B12-binding domain-containing protein [Myxococcota bacterium]
MARPHRVVIAKAGLDGHDRGARIVARALRDAGFEVIYTGLFQTPEAIVKAALEEDADAIGLSILSGAHMHLFRALLALLERDGLGHVVVFGGGIIPDVDREALIAEGVGEIFTPGASLDAIAGWLQARLESAPAGT